MRMRNIHESKMMNIAILFFLLVNIFYGTASYVYEGRHIVKPVHFRRQPTILYASAGFGRPRTYNPKTPSITRFQVFPPPKEQSNRSPKSSYHIPPTFVRSARLHAFNSLFTDRILTKPKRWAISTVYDKPVNENPMDMEYSTSTSMPSTPTTTASTTATPSTTTSTSKFEYIAAVNAKYYEPDSQEDTGFKFSDPIFRNPRAGEPEHMYTVQLSTEKPMFRSHLNYLGSVGPDYRIKQNYLPAKGGSDQPSGFEMEGYQPVLEPEVHEPMRPVRHSPAPWAFRDVYRVGPPRHPACSQPLNRGVGPDEVSSWYFDTELNGCRWFGYRGYGGNANRFYSRTACESLCIRDIENMCDTVKCSWPGTQCSLVGDQACKHTEESYGRDWRLRCPPDQPVCLSRRGTRIAPDIEFKNIPQECFQPKDPGSCERKNPAVMFYYDRERNDCMTFYYHNCGGNDNRFETKSDCMSHCSP